MRYGAGVYIPVLLIVLAQVVFFLILLLIDRVQWPHETFWTIHRSEKLISVHKGGLIWYA